ncbi:alpha-mannosidase [Streptococcus sp. 20-1249]|uniref:alpha-mannosidase n=1 Tax=Streptococcus hepaticus TaxID=3349163 RepID=UPI003747CB45
MTRETVHIISHSHWDREWYLPLEAHRMRLVELFDDLFELFENDPEFKSFHLDGQTIVLDDYLEIRPQNREKVLKYIQEGKLKVGPFYILQDDYLITDEAHARNALIGHLESKKWGAEGHVPVGYYPDTFGNVGQIPQLTKLSGLDTVAFGRGVKPIGFDNQVLSDDVFQSSFSEMTWQGADDSQVLGVLFANWYSNGNEIPAEPSAAKEFWDKKLADARKYASTPHLLFMNGCDHQPVQKDLSQAIQVARDLYPDIDFVHSDFKQYTEAVAASDQTELSVVKGELTSQETDGWYTLANTASTRIYLKQAFDKASSLLAEEVEPFAVISGQVYPSDELSYAWKLLLQNAPHDSICGCSIDEVHSEMEVRLARVQQVGEFLLHRTFDQWSNQLDTEKLSDVAFAVVNPTLHRQTKTISVDLTVKKEALMAGKLAETHAELSQLALPKFRVEDAEGNKVAAKIEDLGAIFDYTLPKDKFRQAGFARKLRVTLALENMAPLSWNSFQLVEENQVCEEEAVTFENNFLAIHFQDGQGLTLTEKATGRIIENFLSFEDVGDMGNEYIFVQTADGEKVTAKARALRPLERIGSMQRFVADYRLTIPVSAADTLLAEQIELVECMKRHSLRSEEKMDLPIQVTFTMYDHSPQLHISAQFTNQMKDHRVRAILATGLTADHHEADSTFETVVRPNTPSKYWENPSHAERHRSFVSLAEENGRAVTVSSKGLHEYEVVDKSHLVLTILRATGELGDWGYFPTPDAQCLREFQVDFTVEFHASADKYAAYSRAKAFASNILAKQVTCHSGTIALSGIKQLHPALEDDKLCVTSLKLREEDQKALIRYYNMADHQVELEGHQAQCLDLLEKEIPVEASQVRPQEIRTELLD